LLVSAVEDARVDCGNKTKGKLSMLNVVIDSLLKSKQFQTASGSSYAVEGHGIQAVLADWLKSHPGRSFLSFAHIGSQAYSLGCTTTLPVGWS
jgi:hypothetical protein